MQNTSVLTIVADLEAGGVSVERSKGGGFENGSRACFTTVAEAAKQVAKTLKQDQRRWAKIKGLEGNKDPKKSSDNERADCDTIEENNRLTQKRKKIEHHIKSTNEGDRDL